ncbi:hypothetical protein ACG74X_02670 [Marivita sp. S0852]|uniref:hypothetical protein n=1 Tax=Marivita sp. S0852 TaxID=3373893 RepID=UPI003981BDAD
MTRALFVKAIAVMCLWLAPLFAASDSKAEGLFLGLAQIADWSTQHAFLDVMKTARPWIGHRPGQWGGVSFEELQDRGLLDKTGWPTAIPDDVVAVESLILTDQPREAQHLRGRYHVFYDGTGRFEITGRGRVISRETGHHIFDYTPGDGLVGLRISETDPSDPIRNIRVVKDDHLDLFNAGSVFNPRWTKRLAGVEGLRFMDWMGTNDSPIRTIEDLPTTADFTYVWRGVPLSMIIALANELKVDPWLNIPHLADDAVVEQMARDVKAQLEPNRAVYVEYSNEVWNFIFAQARWAQAQAEERWGDVDDGWMQFYGLRAAQVMDIWARVFGASADTRLVRVIGAHTGWPGLEEPMLRGALARAALGRDPVTSFDAYAVTGYFGYELSDPATTDALLDAAEARARDAGAADGLSRVALREYVRANRFDGVFADVAQLVREGTLASLISESWPHHAQAARDHGLALVMYEGGTHAAANWDAVDNERLVAFLAAFNYSNEMGALYETVLAAWSDIADSPFNAFVDVAPPSQWGSWGALRHLDDSNPRWDALQDIVID